MRQSKKAVAASAYQRVLPITPAEAKKAKATHIPEAVIEAFNELIAENYDEGEATFTHDAVVKRIIKKLKVTSMTVASKGWLDVESLFEEQGWEVDYDKVDYNDCTGEASFTFSH